MKYLIIILLVIPFQFYGQGILSRRMGNTEIILFNKVNNILNGEFNNPAYPSLISIKDMIMVSSNLNSENGLLKRTYDPRSENNLNFGFSGVKNLDYDGLFIGGASYTYIAKNELFSSIKMNPYCGDPFFINDFNTGDFTYKGPKVFFNYSLPLQDFSIGISSDYRILTGLKSTYTKPENRFREWDLRLGSFYKIKDFLFVGLSGGYKNCQEIIEVQDNNSLEVEVFNFRGDKYFINNRSFLISERLKIKHYYINPELFFENKNVILFLNGELKISKSIYGLPTSLDNINAEYEEILNNNQEGYVFQNDLYLNTFGIIKSDIGNFAFGSRLGINRIWSKTFIIEKTIWDIKGDNIKFNIGYSYPLNNNLLILEYKYLNVLFDSLKHIDNKITKMNSVQHSFKTGFNFLIFNKSYVSLALNYENVNKSMINGMKGELFGIIAGFDLVINRNLSIEGILEFATRKDKYNKREYISTMLVMKYFN